MYSFLFFFFLFLTKATHSCMKGERSGFTLPMVLQFDFSPSPSLPPFLPSTSMFNKRRATFKSWNGSHVHSVWCHSEFLDTSYELSQGGKDVAGWFGGKNQLGGHGESSRWLLDAGSSSQGNCLSDLGQPRNLSGPSITSPCKTKNGL